MSVPFPLDVGALLRILNYLNIGIYITDRDRRIVLWNHKAEEITGYTAADVAGKPCHEGVLEHVDQDGHHLCTTDLCPLHRSIDRDRESDQAILVYARKADGTRVVVSTNTAPLHDESGDVIGGIETFRDETNRVSNLESAKRIQRHLMPKSLPKTANIRFDVRYYPHDLIGGDFYDVRQLDAGRYSVLVADVMGHGVSAALYTMFLRSLGDRFADRAGDPGEFLAAVNQELAELTTDESFATAFYGVVDSATCEIVYSSAGHPGPLHVSTARSRVSILQTLGLPLGIVGDQEYDVDRVVLQPGDVLVGYSDGVTEAAAKQGGMLGVDGLGVLLVQEAQRGNDDLLERLYSRVLDACADVTFSDDVLLLSIARTAETAIVP